MDDVGQMLPSLISEQLFKCTRMAVRVDPSGTMNESLNVRGGDRLTVLLSDRLQPVNDAMIVFVLCQSDPLGFHRTA